MISQSDDLFLDIYPSSFDFSCVHSACNLPWDMFSYVEFPADMYRLPAAFHDPAFLLRDELIERSSIGASAERLFIRSGSFSCLFPPPPLHLSFFTRGLNGFSFSSSSGRVGKHLSRLLD